MVSPEKNIMNIYRGPGEMWNDIQLHNVRKETVVYRISSDTRIHVNDYVCTTTIYINNYLFDISKDCIKSMIYLTISKHCNSRE